jgi:AraC-like DNA-binding protein
VESGEAEHISIHGREHVGPGHLHILHPGQWHGYEEVRSLVLHDIYFPVGLFARELAWMQSDHRLAPIFPMRMPRNDAERRAAPQGVLSMRLDPALFATVHACCMEIQALIEGAGSRRLAAVLARALLLFDTVADHPLVEAARRRLVDPRIDVVCAAMAADLARPWSVMELGRRVGMSAPHLMRLMRRATGQSPIAWLMQRRAEQLAVLLLTRGDSIAGLGRLVGWDDPSYCARRFRACLGCAPDEYRRRYLSTTEGGQTGCMPRRP